MFEYEFVRIVRENKTTEETNNKGKTKISTTLETFSEFLARAQAKLNELGKENWQAVNMSYVLPNGAFMNMGMNHGGFTNYNAAEIVVLLQRKK